MTDLNTPTGGAATGTGVRSRPRAVLPALCATQITSWGIVYYAFPVLNPGITTATGWPTGATMAAFSLALVVSGIAGLRVGRIIDHHGPRTVMTSGFRTPDRGARRADRGPRRQVGQGVEVMRRQPRRPTVRRIDLQPTHGDRCPT